MLDSDIENLNSQTSMTSLEKNYQKISQKSYQQDIETLKNNNNSIMLTLKKAQQIIEKYKKQNEQLNKKNQLLQQNLKQKQKYDHMGLINKNYKKQKQKFHNSKNFTSQQHQIIKSWSPAQEDKNNFYSNRQKEIKEHFLHYFQLAIPSQSQNCKQRQKYLLREIKSLKWKLQQRQKQIIYALKLNKILQQKLNTKQSHQIDFDSFASHKGRERKEKKKFKQKFIKYETESNQQGMNDQKVISQKQ